MEYCIVHYDELSLKKANRPFFESRLVENIKARLRRTRASREYGYAVLFTDQTVDWRALADIPGISHFFIIHTKIEPDIEKAAAAVKEIAISTEFETFKIDTSRHDKNFPLKSMEINARLGAVVADEFDKKVKLAEPELTIYVKVCHDAIYIATEKIKGIGGLPVGSVGKAVCLLSGGIDSPVAAYLANRRGLKIRFIHFKPKIAQGHQGQAKVANLVKRLSHFNGTSELITVDFGPIQDQIIMKVTSEQRMLVYRRFMIRIAERYGDYLVMGDNIAQVASQTLENLYSVYQVAKGLILSPLAGFGKQEIVDIARRIGTYEISVKEYPDCCSYFVPKHPELRATPELLDKVEADLDIDLLVDQGVEGAEKVKLWPEG